MDDSAAWKLLRSRWTASSLEGMTCFECGKVIRGDAAFARTILLRPDTNATQWHEDLIDVLEISNTIQARNRHLVCLYGSVAYIAISHVWHAQVADLQYKRGKSVSSVVEVARLVHEVPARIWLSLSQGLGEGNEPLEIWHDYLSVPQWADQVKPHILREISTLYLNAKVVCASLSDVESECFDKMRRSHAPIESARGVAQICGASYFTRVWTAMEHMHTVQMRVMAKDYKLIAADKDGQPMVHEVWNTWRDITKLVGMARRVEDEVGQGPGLRYPWQLGPIIPVRLDTVGNRKTCFAMVHSALSRRNVTVPTDFFYAFEGVLGSKGVGEPYNDLRASMLRLAFHRLQEGDFSPLFMVPTSADTKMTFDFGFVDLATWGLGVEQEPPLFTSVRLSLSEKKAIVMVEDLGVVQFISRVNPHDGQFAAMSKLCRLALEAGGLDLDAFVENLGVRLYGQSSRAFQRRLSSNGRDRELRGLLEKLCDSPSGDDVAITTAIAEVLGLSNRSLGEEHDDPQSPMDMLNMHGGTLHHGEACAVVGIRCHSCHNIFLIRVALFRAASSLIGCRAYRVPGLKYLWSHAGGMGWLLQHGRMGGRFVWASHTCDCENMAEVEVIVDDLPSPRR